MQQPFYKPHHRTQSALFGLVVLHSPPSFSHSAGTVSGVNSSVLTGAIFRPQKLHSSQPLDTVPRTTESANQHITADF